MLTVWLAVAVAVVAIIGVIFGIMQWRHLKNSPHFEALCEALKEFKAEFFRWEAADYFMRKEEVTRYRYDRIISVLSPSLPVEMESHLPKLWEDYERLVNSIPDGIVKAHNLWQQVKSEIEKRFASFASSNQAEMFDEIAWEVYKSLFSVWIEDWGGSEKVKEVILQKYGSLEDHFTPLSRKWAPEKREEFLRITCELTRQSASSELRSELQNMRNEMAQLKHKILSQVDQAIKRRWFKGKCPSCP